MSDKLWVRLPFGGDQYRLQRHAADRTRTRTDLPDLRVHGAGVDRAFGRRLSCHFSGPEVADRIGDELRLAARGAEIVGLAVILGSVLSGVRIDLHAAHRIDDQISCVADGLMATIIFIGSTLHNVEVLRIRESASIPHRACLTKKRLGWPPATPISSQQIGGGGSARCSDKTMHDLSRRFLDFPQSKARPED